MSDDIQEKAYCEYTDHGKPARRICTIALAIVPSLLGLYMSSFCWINPMPSLITFTTGIIPSFRHIFVMFFVLVVVNSFVISKWLKGRRPDKNILPLHILISLWLLLSIVVSHIYIFICVGLNTPPFV